MRTCFSSGTSAMRTGLVLQNVDVLFDTECRLLQRNLQIITQIRAPLTTATIARAHRPKNLVKDSTGSALGSHPKYFAKDIERIVEPSARWPASWSASCSKGCVPIAIVRSTLVIVHEHLVRFTKLFELLLGMRVARVLVRVKLHRELPIRFFYFVTAGVACNC